MTREIFERALERTARNLFASVTPESVLARSEEGRADEALAAAVLTDLLEAQQEDGSWNGDIVRTAESLLVVHELQLPAGGEAAQRGVAWLRARQDQPGRYGDGCDEERHRMGLCHHFLAGTFAAAAPGVPVSGITLASGARIEGDGPARLAASALALHAVLVWGARSSAIDLHVEALCRMVLSRAGWQDEICPPTTLLVVLGALLNAPHTAATEAAWTRGLDLTARAQRADGTWPGADTFQATEILLLALRAGRSHERVEGALTRVARLLATSQQRDGTWGRETGPRRTHAAWRVFRFALATDLPDGPRTKDIAPID